LFFKLAVFNQIRPKLLGKWPYFYFYSYMRTCAAYDSTAQAIGFDALRVRYRQQRRNLIRELILNHNIGEKLNQYIQTETAKQIPQADQLAFIEDVQEDLEQIEESRLAGLGIDPDQLNKWLQKRDMK